MQYHAPDSCMAVQSAHAGDWLHAPPITAVGLRLSNKAIRWQLACVWVSIYVNHINVNVAQKLTPEDYTAYLAVEVQEDNSVISIERYSVQIAQKSSRLGIQGAIDF